MSSIYVSTLCLLLGQAASDAAPPLKEPEIQIPLPPREEPPPIPPVRKDAKIYLAPGAWYVVNSKVECEVRGYPTGLVAVSAKAGPRDISAIFVDGNGSIQDRTYSGPFLYVVTAVGDGECSLVITPLGLKAGKDIVTANLVVGNTAPQPPPQPKPPGPVAQQDGIFIVIIEETGQAAETRGAMLGNNELAAHMAAKKEKFRVIDQNVKSANGQPPADVVRFLNQAKGKPLPQIYIVDKTGVQLNPGEACPATAQGILDILARYGG